MSGWSSDVCSSDLPVFDLTRPLKGPFAARDVGAADAADAAIQLAKLAGLLPALFIREAVNDDRQAQHVTPGDVASYVAPDRLRIASRAHLPIAKSDKNLLVAFRRLPEQGEHLALLVAGAPPHDHSPLARTHSYCLSHTVLVSPKN